MARERPARIDSKDADVVRTIEGIVDEEGSWRRVRNGRRSYERQILEWGSTVRLRIEDSQEEEWLPEVKGALYILHKTKKLEGKIDRQKRRLTWVSWLCTTTATRVMMKRTTAGFPPRRDKESSGSDCVMIRWGGER